MTDTYEVGAEPVAHPHEPAGPARRRPGRRGLAVIAAVLFVVLVAAIAFAVVMATRTSAYDQQQRDRADAVAVAEAFTRRMDNYDTAHFQQYTKAVKRLLTTKARTDFAEQYQSYLQQITRGRQVSSKGTVLMTGVGESDSDSATVLVVHDVTARSGKASVVHHYRWTVSLAKVHGHWLVDDFSPVS